MLDDKPSPDWRAKFKRLEGAYAPATMRAYYSDLEAYTEWCETTRRSAFPASVETVAAFLDAQSESKAVSTIRRRLYAIRKAHKLLGFPDPQQMKTLIYLCEGSAEPSLRDQGKRKA